MDPVIRSRIVTGAGLILLGLAIYGLQYFERIGEATILIGVGAVFLTGYFVSRGKLLLIGGALLVGLGVGSLGERTVSIFGELTNLSLGVAFCAIYVIALAYERKAHWWPLIPGIVLILLGIGRMRDVRQFLFSKAGWPILLVIVGVLVLLGALGRARRGKRAGS